MKDDRIATARTMADKLREAKAVDAFGKAVIVLEERAASTVLQHLETLARLEERGEELLCEAFEKTLDADQRYDAGLFAADRSDPDGMEGRGMYLEGTFPMRDVLFHILGAVPADHRFESPPSFKPTGPKECLEALARNEGRSTE